MDTSAARPTSDNAPYAPFPEAGRGGDVADVDVDGLSALVSQFLLLKPPSVKRSLVMDKGVNVGSASDKKLSGLGVAVAEMDGCDDDEHAASFESLTPIPTRRSRTAGLKCTPWPPSPKSSRAFVAGREGSKEAPLSIQL
ncbi:hypothetical protein C8034_v008649 [Colletotrichum sidae]|uniref:Uncharacterized protein n=3 Tax=Colletotrichum orbiculare species complex TaxID=2707354 RepID=A0A4R8RBJ3_COLTR|nr:hypothetical protein C8035_v003311 [Colletotrichum spinosum]TDZ53785.1 hypothetical protein CTRI78_v006779 [Colletotrichum trifolii]TEA20443.1 hypothetical protein C8034_v008649 [Colletotrichum sidae]